MFEIQEKTIKYLGKTDNPSAAEVLVSLLGSPEEELRLSAFDSLYLRKGNEFHILLFDRFLKEEEIWLGTKVLSSERLSKIANAAFRSDDPKRRSAAAETILKHRLYEALPTVLSYLEGDDPEMSATAKTMVLKLADMFYEELVNAPSDLERRNFDRRREWFAQQMDGPVKRYAVNHCDELLQALLIVAKKDYETVRMLLNDHRSEASRKIVEYLERGEHGSFIRFLLSFLPDSESPALIDQVVENRSDPNFVRKLLNYVGTNPSLDFRLALRRFKNFGWFNPRNPSLAELLDGLEPNAVQLLQASSIPKNQAILIYRFFLRRPSVESRRAAAEALKRVVGEDANQLILEFVNDPDPTVASTLFRILKNRGVKEVETVFLQLVERPEPEIKQAIYDTMPELHVESFASRIGQYTPMSAQTFGRLVRLIDPNTLKVISDDIVSPLPIRRLSACEVVWATGYGNEFLNRLIELAEKDDETNVRISALHALGAVLNKEALETIKFSLNDRSMVIRDAANAALKQWMGVYQAKMQNG